VTGWGGAARACALAALAHIFTMCVCLCCIVFQTRIAEEKISVDVATARIDKQKVRVEFLLTELRRKQVPHTSVGGKFEGAWVPFLAPGLRLEAGPVPTVYRERWTCCDCTSKVSYFCKPFCGCASIVQQYCEGPATAPSTTVRSPVK
jgi:hypothetical protein